MSPLVALIFLFLGVSYVIYEEHIHYQLAVLDHHQLFSLLMLTLLAAAIGYMFND